LNRDVFLSVIHGPEPPLQTEGRLWFCGDEFLNSCNYSKELPHNARGPLAGEFQPFAACKNLDYPPGNLRFLQFAID